MTKTIAVVGSLNLDLVTRVPVAPGPGATVMGSDLEKHAGGKGLNQAGAAGRLGHDSRTHMIGRVGDDGFGEHLRSGLAACRVDVDAVLVTAGRPSGVAVIVVETSGAASGQNRIIVSPGANDALRPDDVTGALARFAEAPAVLLLQLESPLETVQAAAAHARSRCTTVVLDPAPVPPEIPSSLLRHVDILTPNECEALALLGEHGDDVSLEDAPRVAQRVREQTGVATIILKLGAKGAWLHGAGRDLHVPAPRVEAVDTTAAGDTFNGALAVMLTEGASLEDAVRFSVHAAAVAVTRAGALPSVPSRDEVDALLRQS